MQKNKRKINKFYKNVLLTVFGIGTAVSCSEFPVTSGVIVSKVPNRNNTYYIDENGDGLIDSQLCFGVSSGTTYYDLSKNLCQGDTIKFVDCYSANALKRTVYTTDVLSINGKTLQEYKYDMDLNNLRKIASQNIQNQR